MANLPRGSQYIPPAYLTMIVGQTAILANDWEYAGLSATATPNIPASIGEQIVQDFYTLDITNLITDKNFEWCLTLSGYVLFESEPVGSRGVSIYLVEYSKNAPESEWLNEFGKFIRFLPPIQRAEYQASDLTTSIVPVQRTRYKFSGTPLGSGNQVHLGVSVTQASARDLDVLSGEIVLCLTKEFK